MGLHDLGRVIVCSLAAVGLLGLMMSVIASVAIGGGFAFGGAWSSINLWVLRGLLGEATGRSRVAVLLSWLLAKAALYAIGAVVLITQPLSILAAVIGFHTPFAFALIESARLQDQKNRP